MMTFSQSYLRQLICLLKRLIEYDAYGVRLRNTARTCAEVHRIPPPTP